LRFLTCVVLSAGLTAAARDYHVGPGQPLETLGAVPWFRLAAGDTVYIHHRPAPYREKILISARGTPNQWVRVLGVPGPNGELPVISGDNATTSTNMHYRWQNTDANGIQSNGIIQIAVRGEGGGGGASALPGYIEIANLQVQDANRSYSYTAENGSSAKFDDFAACIYARSAQHILIRNNVMTNCGLGFYNWTGSGNTWYDGLEVDTVLRANYFYNNGVEKNYSVHQSYTESDGVTIEYNRFGPMKDGAMGSQIKDRSAGTIIRYNYVEQSRGWMLDLVEAQNGAPTISERPTYKETWVYGNILLNVDRAEGPAIHWNADQGGQGGRADIGGKLYFYNNTVVVKKDEREIWKWGVFNVHVGGWSCPGSTPGVIDVRNNIIANLSRTSGVARAEMFFGTCGVENFVFGKNWISPGWRYNFSGGEPKTPGKTTGTNEFVSPGANDPGFVNLTGHDVRLQDRSTARRIGGPLAPEVTHNTLGLDLTPGGQYIYHQQNGPRPVIGAGSDAGAIAAPAPPRTPSVSGPAQVH